MHLYHKSVRSAGCRRHCHRLYVSRHSRCVARIHYHGKVGKLVKNLHRRQIQHVSRVLAVKAADSALAKNYVFVSARHNVFGGHQKFLYCRAESALEQYRLAYATELTQKLKVLHISCAYLYHIHLLEHRQMYGVHYLGNYGHTVALTRLAEVSDALLVKSLEIVRRGTWLERAAAQYSRARRLDSGGNTLHLLCALHRARTCHYRKITAAYPYSRNVNHRVVGVEFSVRALERLGDTLYRLHHFKAFKQLVVNFPSIAHKPHYRLIFSP